MQGITRSYRRSEAPSPEIWVLVYLGNDLCTVYQHDYRLGDGQPDERGYRQADNQKCQLAEPEGRALELGGTQVRTERLIISNANDPPVKIKDKESPYNAENQEYGVEPAGSQGQSCGNGPRGEHARDAHGHAHDRVAGSLQRAIT